VHDTLVKHGKSFPLIKFSIQKMNTKYGEHRITASYWRLSRIKLALIPTIFISLHWNYPAVELSRESFTECTLVCYDTGKAIRERLAIPQERKRLNERRAKRERLIAIIIFRTYHIKFIANKGRSGNRPVGPSQVDPGIPSLPPFRQFTVRSILWRSPPSV
jgi:hypothetical protein